MNRSRHPKARHFVASDLFTGLRNFAELEESISKLPTEKERGDALEVFAEAYFTTQQLHQAKCVWPCESIAAELAQRLGLPPTDHGIDGVFETRQGDFVAYQVKFRTGRVPLTWDDLGNFFGLADRVSTRLVFTNSNDVSEIAKQREGFVAVRGYDLDQLEPQDFELIETWLRGTPPPERKRLTPRLPDQKEAIDDILEALAKRDRATALMACGTGKTLVALWVAERIGAHTVLVLVPSLALVRQTLHEWLKQTSWPRLSYRCVCSDPTVDKGTDEWIVHQSDVDFRVTTVSADVRAFLERPDDGVKIVFSTYQSAAVVAEAVIGLPAFDIGIFDEAHKTAGREGMKFSLALQDKNLPIKKRLFMTATPRHYKVGSESGVKGARLIFSMDAPDIYGTVAHRLPFSKAAKAGIICDYKVVISMVTSEMVNEAQRRRSVVVVDGEEVKAQQVANQIALASAVKQYGTRKVFTFHSKVKSAASFSSPGAEGVANHLPGFLTLHINGAMPTARREERMSEFRNATNALMSNARCLTEGVDVPTVDMVAFMSPKRSLVDIVQATGRAMRRADSKKLGYVLVPLYVEQPRGERVEEAVLRTDFDTVWHVLQRLKEHDDLLADAIAQMQQERGRTGGYDDSRFRERVGVIGPEISLEALRKFITTRMLDALGDPWDLHYGELVAYKEEHGDCDMPARWPKNQTLATWVVAQRQYRRLGQISKERIELLDKLNFNWTPKSHGWRERFLELLEYKRVHRDCNVPQNWAENPKLARWVSSQRLERSRGDLSDERFRQLDKIGFEWARGGLTWDARFEQLKEYKRQRHDCLVPARWKENPKLAWWVVEQRYDKRKGTLGADKIRRLDEIGFVWEPTKALIPQWERMLAQLQTFRAEKGDCRVPRDYEPNPRLAKWVARQRKLKKQGKLPEERARKLDSIGFDWDLSADPEETWARIFSELEAFHQRYRHCRVHPQWPENPNLGSWVMRQRALKRKGELAPDRIKRLDALGFEWSPHSTSWKRMFDRLAAFVAERGSCNVPVSEPEHERLAIWVRTQRTARRKGKLTPDKIEQLTALGIDWEVYEKNWNEMFDELVEYFKIQGNCSVPQGWAANPRLAVWMMVQRRFKKTGQLSSARIQKLEEIGFEWSGHTNRPGWDVTYSALQRFHKKHGHCAVSQHDPDDGKLGTWVMVQRLAKRKGRLSPERIQKLETLGIEWEPHNAAWEEKFGQLIEFKNKHDHCAVPTGWPENKGLAIWVGVQRRQKKTNQLSAERVRKLDSIGFLWAVGKGQHRKFKRGPEF
jgi:superfamily II DNA or RNA helicase